MVVVRNPHPDLREVLSEDMAERGLVFVSDSRVGDAWEKVQAELTEAYLLSRQAAQQTWPIVYVVGVADLLGRRGPGPAMVACALLSAARTAGLELARDGSPVNVLALPDSVEPIVVSTWVTRLLEPGGPTGEVIRLGSSHLGKALP